MHGIEIIGLIILLFLVFGGFAVGQFIFWRKTGRAFWRALLPYELRKRVAPKDKLRMDPWMALEEWFALMLLGGYLTLPVIALDLIGFVRIFH